MGKAKKKRSGAGDAPPLDYWTRNKNGKSWGSKEQNVNWSSKRGVWNCASQPQPQNCILYIIAYMKPGAFVRFIYIVCYAHIYMCVALVILHNAHMLSFSLTVCIYIYVYGMR